MLKRATRTGAWPHLREAGLLFGAYLVYLAIAKGLVNQDAALTNADKVVSFERSLGIFWEPAWQEWLLGAGKGAAYLANSLYTFTYMPLVLFTALMVYLKDRQRYRYYRNIILLSLGFFLIISGLFPLSPPGKTQGYGFVDTVTVFGPSVFYGDGGSSGSSFYNTVAAMPSMHFAWTLVFSVMFLRSRMPWLKVVALLWPLATLFSITMTGMHFLTDAGAGAILALLTYAIYETAVRRRSVFRHAAAAAEGAMRRVRLGHRRGAGAGAAPVGAPGGSGRLASPAKARSRSDP